MRFDFYAQPEYRRVRLRPTAVAPGSRLIDTWRLVHLCGSHQQYGVMKLIHRNQPRPLANSFPLIMKDMAEDKITVFIPVAQRFIRPKNTDWHYAARSLPSALTEFCPDLNVVVQQSAYVDAVSNFRKALSIAREKGLKFIPSEWAYELEQDCPVSRSDIEASNARAIFSYERYPHNSFGLPVAWITSPSYPDVMEKIGYTARDIQRIQQWKRSRAVLPARLIFNTQVARDNFLLQNGDSFRAKSVVIPCMLPGLFANDNAAAKWDQGHLRFLFIGRQAIRKGLPPTINAMTPLLKEHPEITFTIVSSMDDGSVEIPKLPNITLTQNVPRAELMRLMADSHFLLMPSWFESYGNVYIEAMSQCCVPLALDNPIQRELIGKYGILVSSQAQDEMYAALRNAVESRDLYRQRALAGLENFKARHTPKVVAEEFRSAIQDAVRGPNLA